MTDDQIEKLVWDAIQKKKITLADMIGGEIVNTDSDDTKASSFQRGRRNRFTELFSEHRIKELLCVGEYDPYNDLPLLKVDFPDLFRFWWNRCIDKAFFSDEVLADIFDYFADQMKPPVPEKQQMEPMLNFNKLDLTLDDKDKAA
jgi:hypothetical protein